MAFKSYLVEKYENTHENIFFRALSSNLSEHFENKNGLHILVGNLSVGGQAIDAIFIKNGAIVVIDFKDYSGTLEFSENGPWRLKTEKEKIVFVAGGGRSRNPFQQVNAYRFTLFQFLSEKQNNILTVNHDNISWDHTCGIVLFQRKIYFDHNTIPAHIQRKFHITDNDNFISRLNDIHSSNLYLNDNEIKNIISLLSISEDDLFDASAAIEEDKSLLSYDPDRMQKIKQLLPAGISDQVKKTLTFYNTMISVEKLNEASVTDIFHLPIVWNAIAVDNYTLDLSLNTTFLNVFLQNRQENFPKNLFISVNVNLNNETVPLFYGVTVHSIIEDYQNINIDFNGFDLFSAILSELSLTEDIIEEIAQKLTESVLLEDKISIVSEILDTPISLGNTISVGLSDESKFTLQLQAEYRNWLNGKAPLPARNSVLDSFLTNSQISFKNNIENFKYVQITDLNSYQKMAVRAAFTQPLLIITGPPGTGKSQVVMNIMANAVVNSQKVLFASKNNKAVDNVYQKINDLLDTDYFIRFGNNEINASTKDILSRTVGLINSENLTDQQEELSQIQLSHNKLLELQSELIKKIRRIPELRKNLEQKNEQQFVIKNDFDTWMRTLSEIHKKLYIDRNIKFNISLSEINELILIIQNRKGFFSKLSFNLFHKKMVTESIKKINSALPTELLQYIEKEQPYFSPDKKITHSFADNLNLIKSEYASQKEISHKNADFKMQLDEITIEIKELQSTYDKLLSEEPQNRLQLAKLEPSIVDSSKKLVKTVINEKLRNSDPYTIVRYADYLINGISWKREEQSEFSRVTHDFLTTYNVVSISNLTVRKAFLQEGDIFDLLIIDEASQCDIASVLPLLYRAKKVVILGDPLQLPHITSIKKQEQEFIADQLDIAVPDHNYVNDSLFLKAEKVSNKNQLKQVFLKEHYRCHPQIIEFCNTHFYRVLAGQELEIKTKNTDFKLGLPGLHWLDVRGEVENNRNVNNAEIEKCVTEVKKLSEKFPSATIGVVTPFAHQKQALQKAFMNFQNKNLTVDTVHRFQGDEKDIIVFSIVVSENAHVSLHRFINYYSAYLLNVAVSRAKSSLLIIGNKDYCKALVDNKGRTLLSHLATYSEKTSKN
ncbi:AAA domain-containing protein [Kaistella pullorum]|uniref:AAA family ATPase n=1 Tax=Kaistella pullorum TaxID=2763074 RepID=A0ABR8WM33_9FLAO|nr:AAA domain-containing protein [Kaistella pullorum]MBD8018136.1 AAA family ATPase [Kaistella pullorum]